jgi:hypothetical protein
MITKTERNKRLQQNEKKWTSTLMDAGWTVMPSIILDKQDALGLDAIDMNILLQLSKYWWYSDNPPRPSKGTIARLMNIDPSTVRRRIKRMESEGLIQREARYRNSGGQEPNFYLFNGLISTVTPFAKEAIEAKSRQKKEESERLRRKKPRLVIDNTLSAEVKKKK